MSSLPDQFPEYHYLHADLPRQTDKPPPQLPPGFLSGLRPAFEGLKRREGMDMSWEKCIKAVGVLDFIAAHTCSKKENDDQFF